jgi:hypothetical protein
MIGKYAALVAVGALCIAGQASAKDAAAAQLSAVKGSVMVSQGGKVVPAAVGALRAGDRVIAANGSAKVSYADGCVVALPANGMATIGAASPCATGAGLIKASQGSSAVSLFGTELDAGWAIGLAWAAGVIILVESEEDTQSGVTSP